MEPGEPILKIEFLLIWTSLLAPANSYYKPIYFDNRTIHCRYLHYICTRLKFQIKLHSDSRVQVQIYKNWWLRIELNCHKWMFLKECQVLLLYMFRSFQSPSLTDIWGFRCQVLKVFINILTSSSTLSPTQVSHIWGWPLIDNYKIWSDDNTWSHSVLDITLRTNIFLTPSITWVLVSSHWNVVLQTDNHHSVNHGHHYISCVVTETL